MSEEKELSLLEKAKSEADAVSDLRLFTPQYVHHHRGDDSISLDGDFTAQELRDLADFMDALK